MESHRIDTGLVDLRTLLQQESSSRRHIQELLTCLPKITETELQDLGHSGESSICYTSPKLDTCNRVRLPHML